MIYDATTQTIATHIAEDEQQARAYVNSITGVSAFTITPYQVEPNVVKFFIQVVKNN